MKQVLLAVIIVACFSSAVLARLNSPKGRVPRACPWVKRSLNSFDLSARGLPVGIYPLIWQNPGR